MDLPHGDLSVSARNQLVFNASLEGENHKAGILKAERIARVLQTVSPRAIVADIGCHNGVYTIMYAQVQGVSIIEGFDIANKALEAARERGLRAFLWNAGMEPCPAETEKYDVIISSEVIEHIVDTEYFVSEIRRILKSKGHVILTTPNLYYWLSRVKFLFAETPWNYPGVSSQFKANRNINTEHIRVNGVKEWSAFFEARGFKVLRTQGLDWVVPSALKARIIHLIDLLMPKNASCLTLFLLQKE